MIALSIAQAFEFTAQKEWRHVGYRPLLTIIKPTTTKGDWLVLHAAHSA
jgi:hypothetical protein